MTHSAVLLTAAPRVSPLMPDARGDDAPELLISRALLQPLSPWLGNLPENEPRVSLTRVNQALEQHEPEAGLAALARVEVGSADVTEYLAASAPSWGQALEVLIRYGRLFSDAVDYALHEHAQRAVFELQVRSRLTRALADYQVGLVALSARSWLGHLSSFECWFAHERPHDLAPYVRVFGATPLHFGAPCDALVFDRDLLEAPLKHTNRRLHEVLQRHADALLSELPPLDLLTGRVRELVLQLLPVGKSDVRHAAERLNMSRRTLARKLKTEGASYREVVEDARHTLARRYLTMPSLDVKEIAFLLGYSETAAFSRAFRRWSGQSPLQYRDSQARGARGPRRVG